MVYVIQVLRTACEQDQDGNEFYFKNKFEKLVHLVGLITKLYHDARSPERQKTSIFIFPNFRPIR